MAWTPLTDKHTILPTFKRISIFTTPYKSWLIGALLLVIAGLVLELSAPLLLRHLIDQTLTNRDLSQLHWIIGGFTLIYVIKFLVDLVGGGLKTRFNENVIRDIRQRLYDHIQTLSPSFFHRNRTGYLTSRIFNDSNMLGGLLGNTFIGILANAVLVLGAISITFILNWKLTIILLLIVPVLIYLTNWFGMRIRSATTEMQEQVSQLCGNIQENLSGITIIQSYTMETFASKHVKKNLNAVRHLNIRLGDLTLVHRTGTLLMTSVAGLLILWFGSRELMRGALTMGDLMAFLAYAVNVYRPVQALMNINVSIQQSIAAAKRIFELLDTRPTIEERPGAIVLKTRVRGAVSYVGVSFAYEKRDVLSDITFEVQPGMKVAIVGRSGAGKTTLLNLLPRFYDPRCGYIELDGTNIQEFALKSLRRQIGIVPQETFLFAGTIRDNLLCCRPDASEEAIKRALELAQLGKLIRDLPRGLDTPLGERGLRLSGGERQRLSIARALLKDPPILILDEATSSVDSISENLIKEALHQLLADRTCFIIAHRLATILDADQILVLDQGKIVGQGKHDDLYRCNPMYTRLYNEQFIITTPIPRQATEEQYVMQDGRIRRRILIQTDQSGQKQVKITPL